eukprot:Hpha_TRINITY_DN20310_c0_g1::TRINITY_DN20310_c0_g1_i1::g.138180::m.138180/K01239/iunH; purine nucleosidase
MPRHPPPPVRALPPAPPVGGGAERTIIDTDPGVDDMWALLTALSPASSEISVEGITIVMGNNDDMGLMARNAAFALELAGHKKVPIVTGRSRPIMQDYMGDSGKMVHHDNGIGGVPLPDGVPTPEVGDEDAAARFIIDKTRESPGEICLTTLGPLTNVARAIQLDPTLPKRIRRVVMMGGSVAEPLGNKMVCGEANIANDPEGARIVFTSGVEVVMAGLNLTHQLDKQALRAQLRAKNDACRFLDAVSQWYCNTLQFWGETQVAVHDPAAVIAQVRPELFKSRRVFLDVELKGELTRGMTVASWRGHLEGHPNVEVLVGVDEKGFNDEMERRLLALPYEATPKLRKEWAEFATKGWRAGLRS